MSCGNSWHNAVLKGSCKRENIANTDLQGPVCIGNLYYMRRHPWDAEHKGIEGSTGTQEPACVTPDPLSM